MDVKQKLVVGTPSYVFWRDFGFFFLIQVLIWIKTIIFFFIFGHGVSYYGQPTLINLPFVSLPFFGTNYIYVFDYAFHQAMHLSIALWVFLVAKHMEEFKPLSIIRLFLVAAVLHNVSYWLTSSHPSVAYSIKDYFTDFIALGMFLLFFMFVLRLVPRLQKIKLPLFDNPVNSR